MTGYLQLAMARILASMTTRCSFTPSISWSDLRNLPLSMKKPMARLLTRRIDKIFLSDFEQGEIGGPVPPPV
jgi:hypothetical protein